MASKKELETKTELLQAENETLKATVSAQKNTIDSLQTMVNTVDQMFDAPEKEYKVTLPSGKVKIKDIVISEGFKLSSAHKEDDSFMSLFDDLVKAGVVKGV